MICVGKKKYGGKSDLIFLNSDEFVEIGVNIIVAFCVDIPIWVLVEMHSLSYISISVSLLRGVFGMHFDCSRYTFTFNEFE